MCLILFGVQPTKKLQLVVAANRDEFYDRPASRAGFWDDHPQVLAGRDLQAGGTWLGVNKTGRFAAVTNFRETPPDPIPPRSRGDLTSGFLTSEIPAEEYLKAISRRGSEYRGFNLIINDGKDTYYYSNRASDIIKLKPGFYGLSNQLLDCDWPKVNKGRDNLSKLIDDEMPDNELFNASFNLLFDTGDDEAFSNSFIATAEYGTCAATVLTLSASGKINFQEQGFKHNGQQEDLLSYSL
jgi:uncharacterized protein with NRDE domain